LEATTRNKSSGKWPVLPGTYQVGDPNGPVAVCALTSERLISPLVAVPGVAIAGMVYTANLGITRIIVNVTSNPAIRFLLICGKDSALFKPGQSLVALAEKGVDDKKRIVDAAGYDPVLPSIDPEQVAQFRKQVEVLDWTGEEDLQVLQERVKSLADRNPGVFVTGQREIGVTRKQEEFVSIRPGGQREPLLYDPKGYFVITIEPEQKEILLRHYLPNHTPAHEMRGRGATSMLLGLLRDGLVTQLSHAGYLGEELAKAQTALQFGLRYDQDRPLRPRETAPPPLPETKAAEPAAPKVEPTQAYSLKKFGEIGSGTLIDLFFSVTDTPRDHILGGVFLDMDDSGAARVYTRTSQRLEVEWTGSSKLIMGGAADVVVGAILRVFGKPDEKKLFHADTLIILTNVAKITEQEPTRGD
jgi:tetrahydromethanopterin S-methyltransferase subunit A